MNIWNEFRSYFADGLTWLADHFSFAGGHRWALAIVALTLIVRILLIPLAIKQIRSMREQQRLQPEVQRLRQKFKNDRQRMTQEMMQLYQREGVNPYAACLPMVAQAPMFIAMFYSIRDLTSQPGLSMPFLGLADLGQRSSSTVGGWMLIIIMTAAQLITTRQLNPGQTEQQRRLQMALPLVFVVLFINFPVALVLYWTTSNLFQLTQQMIMTRDMHPDGVLRALVPWGSKNGKPKGRRTGKAAKKPQVTPPDPVPASPNGEEGAAQRDLAAKRRRRRRKKKKRRR